MTQALRLLARALRRRCPRCGAGGIFASWFRLRPHCPSCGMAAEREEGDWTGAVAVNLVVTEALFVLVLLGGALLTWPDVPWTAIGVVAVVLNIAVPIAFYPLSKTIWVAIDLYFHPLEDLEAMEADIRRG